MEGPALPMFIDWKQVKGLFTMEPNVQMSCQYSLKADRIQSNHTFNGFSGHPIQITNNHLHLVYVFKIADFS